MSNLEDKGDKKPDAIDESYLLLHSKVTMLEQDAVKKDELIAELKKQLAKANDFIEADQKKLLLADIKPRVDIPDEILSKMSMEKLKEMKKTLDVARVPAFKAGTPLSYSDKKPSARQKLDSTHSEYMTKITGGN